MSNSTYVTDNWKRFRRSTAFVIHCTEDVVDARTIHLPTFRTTRFSESILIRFMAARIEKWTHNLLKISDLNLNRMSNFVLFIAYFVSIQFIPMLSYDILSMYNEFHNHMWRSILYRYIYTWWMCIYFIGWYVDIFMKAMPLPLTWSSLDSKEPALPYQCPHSSETKNKNKKKVSVLIWFELGWILYMIVYLSRFEKDTQ